jgi:hypothetical protein
LILVPGCATDTEKTTARTRLGSDAGELFIAITSSCVFSSLAFLPALAGKGREPPKGGVRGADVRHEGGVVAGRAVLPAVESRGRRRRGELRDRPLHLRHLAEELVGVAVLLRRPVVRGAARAAAELATIGLQIAA